MPDVQLNVWIEKQYKDQLEQWKQEAYKPMNMIIEELIKAEMARRSATALEERSLPVIQELIRSEVRAANATLRRELRQDRELEQAALRDYLRRGFDRIAGLTIHAVRNAGFAYRFGYTLLARLISTTVAQEVQEDARQKITEQLSYRKGKTTEPGV